MAAIVGTGVSATADGAAASIQSNAKNTTSGNLLCHFTKWEVSGVTMSGTPYSTVSGDTHTLDQQLAYPTGGEPHGAIGYKANITANAAEKVTANFSAATATFRRIIVEEFSGVATSSPVDGTSTNNSGSSGSFTTGAITTTTSGLVYAGVSGFTTLNAKTATGTPTFTLGISSLTDCFDEYLISGSAQSVTASATSSSSDKWVMLATAFKDAATDTLMGQACL